MARKKTFILLGILFQTSLEIEEKMEWQDKIEIMLSKIASTLTGTIILAGDTNIIVSEPVKP